MHEFAFEGVVVVTRFQPLRAAMAADGRYQRLVRLLLTTYVAFEMSGGCHRFYFSSGSASIITASGGKSTEKNVPSPSLPLLSAHRRPPLLSTSRRLTGI